ncbi:hypothetical protein IQ37_06205 [Chryseobacterium piperi]|uniref:Oligosaccharide repeat unit polymerase n=1 Tax=Chryseobacterium piperi TaxID=558152 RepID=A0A086BKC4_9FLAO|nr:O-antigen polymerase [Chryseobacterium piperi]ASW76164.1 oligosaccharide repeat unit polymerase [Chryseobacterium piperi]KFF29388.1 hypothetical protein IQ37_06205 [Chryseobacterium piperi]
MGVLKKLFSTFALQQCLLLILLYIILFFFKNDYILVFAYIYSLFLGFAVIKTRVEYLLANNTGLIFLLFLFLYGALHSIASLILLDEIPQNIYLSTIIYGATLPSYLLGYSFVKQKLYNEAYKEEIKESEPSVFYSIFLVILLILLTGYMSYFFISIGAFFNLSVLTKDRSEVFETREQSQIVVGLLISGIYLYFIYYYKKISKLILFIISAILLYYVLMQLAAGNRRDFMPMVTGVFWIFVNIKKLKFNLFWFVVLLFSIFIFQYLGTIRGSLSSNTNMNSSESSVAALTNNEFTYPFYTLSFEVDDMLKNKIEYKYGESLSYPVLFFIPRAIYPEKPNSLANQFIQKHFGKRYKMGFAYTPVSEAFVNFGVLGPFFCYFLVGLVISFIQNRNHQVLNFVFFTMILDFCRGELGTFFYQFFFTALFIYILPSIKKAILLLNR